MLDESFIDNDLLISLVKQKPVLWDNTMDLYKNRVATQAAWKQIVMVLNPDVETREEKVRQVYAKVVIQRWTHIRDNYNRSQKKILEQKRSGNGAKRVKPYLHSKQLSFLQKVIQPKETMNNITTDEDDNAETADQENDSYTNDPLNTTPVVTNDTTTKNVAPKRTPKRPVKSDADHRDAKIVKFMDSYSNNEPKVINRHLSFFNGILPSLDNFDEDQVLEFQMGVLQLLKKIKISGQNR